MTDFETMPVGTRETIGAAAQIFRSLQTQKLKHASRVGSPYGRSSAVAATLYGNMATRLEALLQQPNGATPADPPRESNR